MKFQHAIPGTLLLIGLACSKQPQTPTGPGGGGGGGGGGGSGGTGAMDSVAIADHTLQIASGFKINIFVDGLEGVRFLAVGPGNAIYATLSDAGQIVRIRDVDGDGTADSVTTVLSGLDYPSGIAFRGDTMYFAELDAVRRLDPGSTSPVTLVDVPSGGHETRTIVFGPDQKLYLSVGSSCNICSTSPALLTTITRYELNGSGAHPFGTGLRNAVGIALNPTTGDLWAVNNERDDIGPNQTATDSLPPDELDIVQDGKWYGFPQCYAPGKANPEFAGSDCAAVDPAALTFTAHSAPLGIVFYEGTTFPAAYRGDAFVSLHGSWDRSKPTGAKVVRVQVGAGRPTGVQDFVTGWQLSSGERWGRPVAVLGAPDGALLISDDLGNRVWRVSH